MVRNNTDYHHHHLDVPPKGSSGRLPSLRKVVPEFDSIKSTALPLFAFAKDPFNSQHPPLSRGPSDPGRYKHASVSPQDVTTFPDAYQPLATDVPPIKPEQRRSSHAVSTCPRCRAAKQDDHASCVACLNVRMETTALDHRRFSTSSSTYSRRSSSSLDVPVDPLHRVKHGFVAKPHPAPTRMDRSSSCFSSASSLALGKKSARPEQAVQKAKKERTARAGIKGCYKSHLAFLMANGIPDDGRWGEPLKANNNKGGRGFKYPKARIHEFAQAWMEHSQTKMDRIRTLASDRRAHIEADARLSPLQAGALLADLLRQIVVVLEEEVAVDAGELGSMDDYYPTPEGTPPLL